MEDLADLQVAAGHTVAFFGMAHPLNTHLEYASHYPDHIELEPPPPTLTGRVRGVARMLYSTSAKRGMEAVLADFRPDVVHMHNIYHQLSPSVLRPVARTVIRLCDTDSDGPERGGLPVSRSTARRCSRVAPVRVTVPVSGRPASSRSRARWTSQAVGSPPSRRCSRVPSSAVSVTPSVIPPPGRPCAVPGRPIATA